VHTRDTFTITTRNGAGATLPEFAGFVQGVLHSIAVRMGIAKPDSVDRSATVTLTGTGVYGDNSPQRVSLWRKQDYFNCVLMASAMAAAQVT